MHTLSFLMAMERFLVVHPRPAVLLADNGTNFHGGEKALKGKDQISMSHAQRKLNIKFEFAPPKTPHFQGLMKRIVGAAKAAIKPALRTRVVTGEKLRTIFAKAMGILNNFPISYTVKSGMDFYYRPLTPNHFLLEGIIAKPKLGALPFPLIIIFKDDNGSHVTFVKSLQIAKCKEISSRWPRMECTTASPGLFRGGGRGRSHRSSMGCRNKRQEQDRNHFHQIWRRMRPTSPGTR
jgi:hypothetical protein